MAEPLLRLSDVGLVGKHICRSNCAHCMHTNTDYVISGARRVTALQALRKEGNLHEYHSAQCQIADDEHPAELSLAENVVRAAMHPADEFEDVNRLATKNKLA
jgi:ParB-like chromosome segregation protein Spo0J